MPKKKELLEFQPGYHIEVTPFLKKLAGVKHKSLRRKITAEERAIAIGIPIAMRRWKYSEAELSEAVRISKEIGVTEASKLTGIKFWSIVQHKRRLAMAGIYKPKNMNRAYPKKYSDADRQMFMEMVRYSMKCGMSKAAAFKSAGKRTGFNAMSLLHQYDCGMLKDRYSPPSIRRVRSAGLDSA